MALGMTMNGASNATYAQMKSTLGFGAASDADVNASYKSTIALLRGLDPSVDFRIANSIWYRNTFAFNQSFLDVSKSTFDAQVSALDFGSPSSVATINNWVSSATSGRIPTIVDNIGGDQVMFLVNAIYFKGAWRDKFDPTQTQDAPFHGVAGDQTAKLMHRHGPISFYFSPQFFAAELPYGNKAFAMTILVPRDSVSVEAVAASLQASTWNTIVASLHELTTDVYLPKLQLQWSRTLNDDLAALGMHDAFDPASADFTRMSPAGRSLYVNEVKQKTFVDITEEGTEAAAVTNVGIAVTSLPPSLRADKPFIFVIRDRLSGTILFMGKIVRMP
jgi:serpin B